MRCSLPCVNVVRGYARPLTQPMRAECTSHYSSSSCEIRWRPSRSVTRSAPTTAIPKYHISPNRAPVLHSKAGPGKVPATRGSNGVEEVGPDMQIKFWSEVGECTSRSTATSARGGAAVQLTRLFGSGAGLVPGVEYRIRQLFRFSRDIATSVEACLTPPALVSWL